MENKNDKVTLSGVVNEKLTLDHEVLGEAFYKTHISVERRSGSCDIIPIIVSDRLIDVSKDYTGKEVFVDGQFRSYSRAAEEKGQKLILFVFADCFKEKEESDEISEEENRNSIYLNGYVCKAPVYRETPLGRKITDIMIAVNRPYGKSDYIPILCWGRNAVYSSHFEVGTKVELWGRVQSRKFIKKHEDGTEETRVAYEISVLRIKKDTEDDSKTKDSEE